jgi:ABC-type Fe3+ transport system permease subunit
VTTATAVTTETKAKLLQQQQQWRQQQHHHQQQQQHVENRASYLGMFLPVLYATVIMATVIAVVFTAIQLRDWFMVFTIWKWNFLIRF